MRDVRLGLPNVLILVVLVGTGAFAAGRAMPVPSTPLHVEPAAPAVNEPIEGPDEESDEPLPPGHPPTTSSMGGRAGMALPAGHPPVDPKQPAGPIEAPAAADEDTPLRWTAPARWQVMPNPSNMRLATYRVPRAPGDAADGDLSVTRAGGSAEANIERWIGQFDESARQTARRTTRKVGSLDVSIVEIQGTYTAGMGAGGSAQTGWALLGAIVLTPGTPHFFKLTGPAKSVLAARTEFDALIGSLTLK
jgi:hypothetical protein